MAQATMTDSQLRLSFDMGVDENGKAISKNYHKLKTSSTTDDLYAVAQAFGNQ